jgi:hypothetical protein
MAHTILIGLHAPALVSDVEIDAGAAGKAKTQACTIDKLECSPSSVSFDRTDQALPMPMSPQWFSLLPYVDHLKDLNWYGLKVTGLGAGKYGLSIDGKEVARFSADQLAEGVNLGLLTSGPVFEQGQKAFQAIQQKNQLLHRRFRDVMMYQAPTWLTEAAVEEAKAKELARRMEEINAKQAEIYKLVQPVPHHFELKPATATSK